MFDEKHLVVRVDAIRLGLAVGGFSGLYEFILRIANRYEKEGLANFLAGLLAGSSILFLEKDTRRMVSLYVFGRVFECIYNSRKNKGLWHFWGSSWNHGDTLLFCLASGQVMYAYVMRPETLDPTYYKFILRTGPISEVMLQAVRACNRNNPIPVAAVTSYVQSIDPQALIPLDGPVPIIPCSLLHPHTAYCSKQSLDVFLNSFKKILPLYATLTFLPAIGMAPTKFFKAPFSKLVSLAQSTLRSTTFLSTFVSVYMSIICLQRKIVNTDHRFIYWIAGIICSLSILIEKKSRRSELALYALPRGIDSLYTLLCDRKWLASLPHGDLILFCLSMAGIMYYYEKEPNTMSPFLRSILNRVLDRK